MSDTLDDDATPNFSQSGDPLQNSLIKSGLPATEEDTGPVYKMMKDTKVAVSKARGKLVKSRIDAVKRMMKDNVDAWDEAIRYYNNDQSAHRDGQGPDRAAFNGRGLHRRFGTTENVVFSNVSSAVPQLYAKNPIVSMASGPNDDDDARKESDAFARAVEKLVNVLIALSSAPGVNAKPKFKRAVLIALLTNAVWLEVGYTKKDDSSEKALADLQTVSKALAAAKDAKTIQECEGQLMALEEKVEFLNPSGPFLRLRLPHQVLVDPDHNDSNGEDAKWIAVQDMLPTDYLNAVYGMDNDTGKVVSVYEPTHILDGNGNEADDIRNENFSIFQSDKKTYNAYGYQDDTSFNRAKRTEVWYFWDKVTQRLELYASNNWTWPVWVWDDPYQLQGFFPLSKLWFHENPIGTFGKGEVSYYLDQQDEINEINDEHRKALQWTRRNIFYNKNKVDGKTVEDILKGNDNTAIGLDVPDGVKVGDIVFSIPPPSMQFQQLFDKKDLYAAIDRIAATSEVQRGGEFKTNTTNKAVDYYASMGNNRNDARLDALEDCIGRVGWQIAQLCLNFMDASVVTQLIGEDVSAVWKPLDPLKDYSRYAMTCIGGSTTKMSNSARKQEAVQVTQILAQFVKAAPAATLTKTLEIFARSFDDVLMSKTDWQDIEDEVKKTLQMSQGGAPGQVPPGGGPELGAPGGAPPGTGPQPGGPGPAAAVQALQQLPPPLLKAIGVALAQGHSPQEVFAEIMQHMQGGQSPSPQPPQPNQGAA